jgi:hypothetical protein
MDRSILSIAVLLGAVQAGFSHAAEPDFEATISAVERGSPLTGIPDGARLSRPDIAEAEQRGDVFASGRQASLAGSVAELAGLEIGGLSGFSGLSGVQGVLNNLDTNVVGAVSELAEITELNVLDELLDQGLLGNLPLLGGRDN